MEEREPAKTPAEHAGGGKHRQKKQKKKQGELPANFSEKDAAVNNETAEQGDGRNETTGKFCRAM